MRLVSCFIENFGKYQNTSFDFDQGLTSYMMDNGEGKTTLAAFLRVMLYGMGTDRKDVYGMRSRYYPFQGGNYGGWLQIEWQGNTYKIVRCFDKKSAPKDTLTVFDERGKECVALGAVPGQTVFGLTEEAFLRTSYVTYEKLDIDLQHGIGERLCGLVSDTSSVPLDKALSALEDYEKTYHSGRRKSGIFTGYIPETEEKIASLQAEIYASESRERELFSLREEYKTLYEKEGILSVEIEKMQEAGTRRTRWEYYNSLCQAAKEEGEKRLRIEARYSQGFPSFEEVKTVKENLRAAHDTETRLHSRGFFGQAELDKKEEQFCSGIPTPERLGRIEGLVEEYLSQENNSSAASVVQQKPKKSGSLFALLTVALLLVFGALLLLESLPIVAAVLAVIGVVMLAVDLVLYRRAQKLLPTYALPANPSQNTQQRVYLEDFFWAYGLRMADFSAALRILKEDIQTLYRLRQAKQAYDEETQALSVQVKTLTESAQTILCRYALSEDGFENAMHDASMHAEAARLETQKSRKAEEYRLQYGLSEEPQGFGEESLEERKQQYRILQERVRDLRAQMQKIETELERIPQLKYELSVQKELLEKYLQEKELIGVTVAALQAADGNLKDTYLLPMQKSFLFFAKQMGAEWADSITLGDELQIFFEERGQLRREEHFSDGQRALAALAMRLALMENIHKGETPFCILDDPFVYLDERHLEEVKEGLRALSRKMQIVYFTCHSSRMI